MSGQWAKVPEDAAYVGLDATAHKVLIVLAAKAGPNRTAWISQKTVAARLRVTRQAIGMAMKRLEETDLIRKAGTVVINPKHGTWVRKWQVAPYLPDANLERTSDVPDANLDLTSGWDPMQISGDPMQVEGVPDAQSQARSRTHSVPKYQSLNNQDEQSTKEEQEERYPRATYPSGAGSWKEHLKQLAKEEQS
jgi:hypothetical protein